MQTLISQMICLVSLDCIFVGGCSRPSLTDDLERARRYRTIVELEKWLGEPTAITSFRELEEHEQPDGMTFTDADGNSLGHGEYVASEQSGTEIRQYEHPNRNGVRFLVSATDGKIGGVDIIRRAKMVDEPSDRDSGRTSPGPSNTPQHADPH